METLLNQRTIKSYVIRGRTSNSQKKALKELSDKYAVQINLEEGHLIHPSSWFENSKGKVAIEIGFGMGENLLHNAENQREFNWLGIETHDAGVGRVFNFAEKLKLNNLKIYHGDTQILLQSICDSSLSWVQLFFPDPWPKKKHHKRRLISKEFIAKLAQKMQPLSKLEIATDWQNYADTIEEVFLDEAIQKEFIRASESIYSERSEFRVLTNFEKKAEKAERKVNDFCFIKK